MDLRCTYRLVSVCEIFIDVGSAVFPCSLIFFSLQIAIAFAFISILTVIGIGLVQNGISFNASKLKEKFSCYDPLWIGLLCLGIDHHQSLAYYGGLYYHARLVAIGFVEGNERLLINANALVIAPFGNCGSIYRSVIYRYVLVFLGLFIQRNIEDEVTRIVAQNAMLFRDPIRMLVVIRA